jgi:type I restriction enzyme S subunit
MCPISWGQYNTSPERIYDVSVYIPPLPIQRKIGKLLASIDAKIIINNRINARLETAANLLFDYWFVQFDFPNAADQPYATLGGELKYSAVLNRAIPYGWMGGTANDLGSIVGGSTPSTKIKTNFTKYGTPWITPNDLSENAGNKYITRGNQDVTAKGIKDASLKVYPSGTVLLSSRAPIGYMAIAREPLTTNQGFKSFVPDKGYPKEYVYYAVKNILNTAIQYSSGSTFKEISGSVLKAVNVCLPPKKLAERFATEVGPIFDRQDLLEQENARLAELRDWLLPLLINGQVMVNTRVAAI